MLDKMRSHTMAVHAAVLCLLLFAGRLAGASKVPGGYGGEAGGGGGGETDSGEGWGYGKQAGGGGTGEQAGGGGGGYGGETGGSGGGGGGGYPGGMPKPPLLKNPAAAFTGMIGNMMTPATPSTPAADATAAKDASYGTLTPTTPGGGGFFTGTLTPSTPAGGGSYSGGTPTPSTPSTPAESSGGTETPSTPSTPAAPAGDESGTSTPSGGESSSSTSPGMDPYSGQPSTPAASSEPENGLNQKAINDIVNEHNVMRAKEHVRPLVWNTTLAQFAQQYAEKLKASGCQMVHSTSPYGENLMYGTGAITWKTTVDEWSAEKKSYNYGANTCEPGKMCGHYTAVVWKDTTSVGCGRVKCGNGGTMEVCSYWPPGNYEDKKPY